MKLSVEYKDFSEKLKTLWDTSGQHFPPTIISNTVYFNGKHVGTMCEESRERVIFETDDLQLQETIESGNFTFTYSMWLNDDYFSYIVIPLCDCIKKEHLTEYNIIRMNPKMILYRLKIFGMDYCFSDLADDPATLFVYKEHPFREQDGIGEMFNDPKKRIGYLLSIRDDYITVLLDKNYYKRVKGDLYARFCTMGERLDNGDYSVKKINRIELIRRNDTWRGQWADSTLAPGLKDNNASIKYRG